MNKAAIKSFAVWSRSKLIAELREKAGRLGLAENNASYDHMVEDAATIWFNRLVTVRFMEVNHCLPCGVRVLSSINRASLEPDIVAAPFLANLNYTPEEKERISELKNTQQLDELFRLLLFKQFRELHDIMPACFEMDINGIQPMLYELLLSLELSYTDREGIVYHLIHDIAEEDFQENIEIIGWLYQFYNDERKNAVINIYKGCVSKEDIPAATQLFTPGWIVRYMVDNSLGRYWLERNPQSRLREKLTFLIEPENQPIRDVGERIDPRELTLFDPCMGSGHILVYAFDVLMVVYRECGYSDQDAAVSILKHNLYGLDIDDMAYRLTYFALLMQARKYCPDLFERDFTLNVYGIEDSEAIAGNHNYLHVAFAHANEIGSILKLDNDKLDNLLKADDLLPKLTRQAEIMTKKYAAVCTNPPYMNKFQGHLKDYVRTNYKAYSGDLFSVYMVRNFDYCLPGGYSALMTPFVWMFIQSYEALREFIIDNKAIISLIQMEYSAYDDATVPICTLVLKNDQAIAEGCYIKLTGFKGGMEVQKNKVLDAIRNNDCGYVYLADARNFKLIPGKPIAYWVSDRVREVFAGQARLGERYTVKQGMATGNNEKFLRLWHEVDYAKIGFNMSGLDEAKNSKKKWFPYNKGGEYRLWYGNNVYVVNWENDGAEIKEYTSHLNQGTWVRLKSREYYFKESITWSFISSSYFGVRYSPQGFIFDVAGSSLFAGADAAYILAFLSSKVAYMLLQIINPTLNYQISDVKSLPLIIDSDAKASVETLAAKCIALARSNWNSYENSWDFLRHPFLTYRMPEGSTRLEDAYAAWSAFTHKQFKELKSLQEEINRIFIRVYGLQEEMLPDIPDRDVTIGRANHGRDVRSFLSYVVGCLFGRYSPNTDGLITTGGERKERILLIPDTVYIRDDIVGLVCNFLQQVFGRGYLEENLNFIADALGGKSGRAANRAGRSARVRNSRDVIRKYFLNEFFRDHCQTYHKRPIYWLFDSGRAHGFKALVYMQSYHTGTIEDLRVNGLNRVRRIYETEIDRLQEVIDKNGGSTAEAGVECSKLVTAAVHRQKKLRQKLIEVAAYNAKISQLAAACTPIDLDDGVKCNYTKIQTIGDGRILPILKQLI
ncbi:BREX-1 system adenine-specific DNA-methyltransferase PglX [Dehalobacter sp. DCM]|uniref:BREX-1 system adenine-specific DNA-methyltransferase PglX n=1 Tax=Dehalobacter sp. DCM TaxID=2907827 RepID=UPI00308142C0|nr:BREX-1 system adenine-specific DNA-methyltransferase PglX [Dehalobacter sp. DCM]